MSIKFTDIENPSKEDIVNAYVERDIKYSFSFTQVQNWILNKLFPQNTDILMERIISNITDKARAYVKTIDLEQNIHNINFPISIESIKGEMNRRNDLEKLITNKELYNALTVSELIYIGY
jgi:hypothetical protein